MDRGQADRGVAGRNRWQEPLLLSVRRLGLPNARTRRSHLRDDPSRAVHQNRSDGGQPDDDFDIVAGQVRSVVRQQHLGNCAVSVNSGASERRFLQLIGPRAGAHCHLRTLDAKPASVAALISAAMPVRPASKLTVAVLLSTSMRTWLTPGTLSLEQGDLGQVRGILGSNQFGGNASPSIGIPDAPART